MKKSLLTAAGITAAFALSLALFAGCPTDGGGGDVDPPVLNAGNVVSTLYWATVSFTSNKAGTWYYVALPVSDSAPDAGVIKAQTAEIKGTGSAAAGTNTFTVTDLTSEAGTYTAYIVAEDAEGNSSGVLAVPGIRAGSMNLLPAALFSGAVINAIAYGNGIYVAGAANGSMAWSEDAAEWTEISAGTGAGESQFSSSVLTVIYANNIFVAGGINGQTAWSADGKNWTAGTGLPGDAWISTIVWDGTRFVAAAATRKICTSTDGKTWSVQDPDLSITTIAGIAYGNGRYVVVGTNSDATNGRQLAWSDNLTTWTGKTHAEIQGMLGAYVQAFNAVTFARGIFVAVGQAGKIAWSDNGETWNTTTGSPFGSSYSSQPINAVTYANGAFVAAGGSGTMGWSPDGNTWNTIEAHDKVFGTSIIRGLTWGGGKFVAVGANGKIAYSE
ncbi:MAG: hypothetical protein LBQ35_05970 [Spirochaetaceae bacterium]|jgi:hypothetical protein|nr:hypothetical protein [Spirochaetaceae bacterium]